MSRSPGTVSKWIQPQTSGNVIAAARMQPHMISQCASPRRRPRRKMKRLAANSTRARRQSSSRLRPRKPRRAKNDLPAAPPVHPRRRPLQPHRVAIGDAEGREQRRERVADQRRVEVRQVARADHDQAAERGGEQEAPAGRPELVGCSARHDLLHSILADAPRQPRLSSRYDRSSMRTNAMTSPSLHDRLPPRLLPVLYFGAAHVALALAFAAIAIDPRASPGSSTTRACSASSIW